MQEQLVPIRIRTQRTLRIALAWVISGTLAALFEHNALRSHGVDSDLWDRMDERFLSSLLIGLIAGGLYIFLLRNYLRRFAYFKALMLMALIMLPVVAVLGAWLPGSEEDAIDRLLSLGFLGEFLYWMLLMSATMLMVRLNDQYGSGGIGYLTGKYHRPKQELRVFMFLDMRSSTAIAERIGHVKFFQLMHDLYSDITDPILYSRGEIYQYVGDEISVSWPFRRGIQRQRCIRCFLDIRAKLKKRAPYYEARYGIIPLFKAGFHYGQVTTGEVGVVKRERIFSGDVVNTAARIQNSCNAHGVDNLVSKELLEVLHLPSQYRTREIGDIMLRGKRDPMGLWTILHEDEQVPAAPRSEQMR